MRYRSVGMETSILKSYQFQNDSGPDKPWNQNQNKQIRSQKTQRLWFVASLLHGEKGVFWLAGDKRSFLPQTCKKYGESEKKRD